MSAYNDMLNIIMSRQTGLLFVAFVLVAVAITLLANRSEKEGWTSKTPPAVYKIDRNWCNSCGSTSNGQEVCTRRHCPPRYLKTESDLNPYDLCGTNQIIDFTNQNCIERNISTKNNTFLIKDSEDKPIWELKRNGDIKLLHPQYIMRGTIIDKQEVMKAMKNSYEKIFKEKYGSSEDPVVEDPVVEDPVVEDPVVEDPVVEEPIVEDPVVEDPVVEDPVVEEPVDDEDEDDEDEDDEDNEDDTNVFLIASIVIGSLAALVGGGYYIKKSRTALYI